jgi:protocatechuate 3,4-dioxygenase beta subunit
VPVAVTFRDQDQPTNYLLKLAPAQPAAGRILDTAGRPVAGVKVGIQGPGAQPGRQENMDFQNCSVTSDDQGRWSLNYLPQNLARDFYPNKIESEVRFILTRKDFAVTLPVVPASQTDLTSLTFVINRGFTVTGTITDTNNRPLAGARVQELHNYGYRRQSTKTDDTGWFTLTGVANYENYESGGVDTNGAGAVIIRNLTGTGAAFVNLSVQLDGYESQTHHVPLTAPTNTVQFTLLPGHILRGRVVDEAGIPINHAVVQADWDSNGLRQYDWDMQTEWDGLFEWNSAPAEPVGYWIEAAGYEPLRGYSLTADNTDHEIVLKRIVAH